MGALITLFAALASGASSSPALAPSDQAAIMKVLCEGDLKKDAHGWICRGPGEADDGVPWEERWESAYQGRFVARPDEWIVSTRGSCTGPYCPASAYVVRKVGGTWRRTHEIELDQPLPEDCLRFGGMPDGLDRLACVGSGGLHQGFLSLRLAVMSFAGGEQTAAALMQKDLGGECFLVPPAKEMKDDDLTLQRAGGEPRTAFTVRLEVRRAPCDTARDEGNGPIVVKASHVLRFVRRGNDVVPDDASARIIAAEDWAPMERP
jgi:hypothetical protein